MVHFAEMNHERIGNGTAEEEANGSSPHSLQLWIWVSRIQVWVIPILSAFSIVVILKVFRFRYDQTRNSSKFRHFID